MKHRNSKQNDPTRRAFMWQAACAAVGATSIASTVWDLRLINAAAASGLPTDYKALVCVFLYGGNDSNNLLVPSDSAGYSQYASSGRGVLTLPSASLNALNYTSPEGSTWGLHPSCPQLAALFNGGQGAILANVGTLLAPTNKDDYQNGTVALPPQLFSHSDQQAHWQTSLADQPVRTGWGGRTADLLHAANGNPNVSMSVSIAGANTFELGNVVTEYSVSTTGATKLSVTNTSEVQAIRDLIALNQANLYESTYSSITQRALDNGDLLNTAIADTDPTAHPNYWTTAFPTSSLGQQLQMVGRLIQGAIKPGQTALPSKRQIFFVAISGYDLHSGEIGTTAAPTDATVGSHANLLADLNASINAFYAATVQLGVQNKVTTFTASDFTRTLAANGNTGSDHGWGGHAMIFGGDVVGKKIYGKFPTLQVNGPDDAASTSTNGLGRWIPTTSVDEYAATLATWFGVAQTDLSTVLPNIGRFANPNLGFLVPPPP